MMKFLFIIIVLFLSCTTKKESFEKIRDEIFQKKGFYTMPDMIIPEIPESPCVFSETISLLEKNRFACIVGCEFGFGVLTEDLKLTFDPIKQGFSNDAVGTLGADENGLMIWGKQGYCGFLAIDTKTKDTVDFIPSVWDSYGKDVYRAYLTGLPKQILLFHLNSQNINLGYMLYDFTNKKNLFIPTDSSTTPVGREYHKIAKITYLIETGLDVCSWYIADLTEQGFINWRKNKLTDSLSQKNFRSSNWTRSSCFHAKNRMLIGRVIIASSSYYVIVRWDEEYSEIRIEPLKMQCPSEYSFSKCNWTFSLDGHWLFTTARKVHSETGQFDDPELVFYHVDPKYPQGISPPVFAGKTGETVYGCFIDHSKLGMVFLDIQTGHDLALVYKMSDMLPIIAKKLSQIR